MREVYYITKRNCQVFFRDKAAVFFSILSMLIVLGLMVIFLGSMNSRSVVNVLAEYGGIRDTAKDEKNAEYLIQLWTLAGILAVNSVTVTLTVMGNMVQDETRKRIMAFYVTPVNRIKLTLGYIFSAWLVGIIMCVLTLGVGELYFWINGNDLLPVKCLLQLCGMICANTFTFSALGYLMALFIHSDSAWSGLLTVIGTLVGFVGGIYIPVGSLSGAVQNVLKCLPVLHGVSMMRQVASQEALENTFRGLPEQVTDIFSKEMGITIYAGEHCFLAGEQLAILAAYAIIAIVTAALINRKRRLKDR